MLLPPRQLVVWLAVCDMFANLSYFLGSHIEGSMLCYIQAIVQQFFQVRLKKRLKSGGCYKKSGGVQS